MFEDYYEVFLSIGFLTIVVLSVYIYRQLQFLKTERAKAEENLRKLQEKQAEKYKYVTDSLKIISQAIIEDQVDVIEGSIRVKALLDHYDPAMTKTADYTVFETVFSETEHIPIKEAWKALDRKSKQKHQKLMDGLSEQYGSEVKLAARSLLEHFAQTQH